MFTIPRWYFALVLLLLVALVGGAGLVDPKPAEADRPTLLNPVRASPFAAGVPDPGSGGLATAVPRMLGD